MPDNKTSFLTASYSDQPGGKPQTEEEEAFILDYMERYGLAPTGAEVAAGMGERQGRGELTYTPESTMGQLGFKNLPEAWSAWNQGESYGPWAGEGYGKKIPMGGIVTTDELGRPKARYFQFNEGLGAREVAAGRYIMPSGGVEPNLAAQLTQLMPGGRTPMPKGYESEMPGVYPRRTAFTMPDINDPLKYNPNQVYSARYQDYLNSQVEKDVPVIKEATDKIKWNQDWYKQRVDDIQSRFSNGEISKEQAQESINFVAASAEESINYWQDILDNAMTAKKAQGLYATLQKQIGKGAALQGQVGLSPEGLTTLTPSEIDFKALGLPEMPADFKGAGTLAALFQAGLDRERKAWEESQPRQFAGYNRQTNNLIGDERQRFSAYIRNYPSSVQNWLANNYNNLFAEWQNAGMTVDFIIWLQRYLASGGQNA